MRHLKAGKRLGITTSHRKILMRNLVTALLEHGEIKVTMSRAKEMRKYLDKMIGHGKKGTLHSRRQALSFIKSKDIVAKLFEEYGPLYRDRCGGYTRIFRFGNRLGDNAQMALIQMVGVKETETVKAAETESITEIKEELQEKETLEAKEVAEEKEEVAISADKKEEAQEEPATKKSDSDK